VVDTSAWPNNDCIDNAWIKESNKLQNFHEIINLCRGLNKVDLVIGEARTKTIMRKLNLVCSQRRAYKCTTNSNHNNAISANLLD